MKLAVSMNHMRNVCRRSWYSWNPGQVIPAWAKNTNMLLGQISSPVVPAGRPNVNIDHKRMCQFEVWEGFRQRHNIVVSCVESRLRQRCSRVWHKTEGTARQHRLFGLSPHPGITQTPPESPAMQSRAWNNSLTTRPPKLENYAHSLATPPCLKSFQHLHCG